MPINVEEELAKLALEDINLQSQINTLSECCATCGLQGGMEISLHISILILVLGCTMIIAASRRS